MKHWIASFALAVGLAQAGNMAWADDSTSTTPNNPPEVRLTHPPDGAEIPESSDILLVAQAEDEDGRVVSVEFFANGESLGIVDAPPVITPPPDPVPLDPPYEALSVAEIAPTLHRPFRLKWEDVPAGDYQLVAVATDDCGDRARSAPVSITVFEVQRPPIVAVKAVDPHASEGPPPDGTSVDPVDTATFVIGRHGPTEHPLTVYYSLTGTAENGEDYRELPTRVVIPEGQTRVEVVVWPIDDNLVEGPESVVLRLREVPCEDGDPPSPQCYLLGRYDKARAAIRDNDTPPNHPPHVRLVRPEDGEIFRAESDIRLAAFAADRDGEVTQVEFFEGDTSLGVVTAPTPPPDIGTAAGTPPDIQPVPLYQLLWEDVPAGCYRLLAVATDDDGAVTRSRPVHITVVAVQPLPVVTIEAVDPEATEPTLPPPGTLGPVVLDTARFLVSRTGPLFEPLVVFYRAHGTATNGEDYRELVGRVEIPAGRMAAPIDIIPLDDDIVEGDESVVIQVVSHLCTTDTPIPSCYRVGEPGRARAVIHDNDEPPANRPPVVRLTHPLDGTVFPEGDDIRVVARAADPDGAVVLVKFFANGELIGLEQRDANSDDLLFGILWEDVPAGPYRLVAEAFDNDGASTKSDPVHIRVIEIPPINVVNIFTTDPLASEGGDDSAETLVEAPNTASFRVIREGPLDHELLIHYDVMGTADNGEDYELLSGELLLEAGSGGAPLIVVPIDDNLHEDTETVVLRLRPVPCPAIWPPSPGCYRVGEHGEAGARILDNDPPPNLPPEVGIVHPENGSVFLAPADIPVGIRARDPDGWVERVRTFANGVLIDDQSIFFIVPPPPGEVQVVQFLWEDVPAGIYELVSVATDQQGSSSRSEPVRIRVREEPPQPPPVNIFAIDPFASEGFTPWGYNPALFRVRRGGDDLMDPLTVDYAIHGTADNGIDYQLIPGQVTIAAGLRSAPIIIGPLDDLIPEFIETVILQIVVPETAPPPYVQGNHPVAGAIIVDNDFPFPGPPCVPAGDGSVYICSEAVDGEAFEVQMTTDFQTWTPMETVTAVDGGAHFLDPEAGESGVKAYRFVPVGDNPHAADD